MHAHACTCMHMYAHVCSTAKTAQIHLKVAMTDYHMQNKTVLTCFACLAHDSMCEYSKMVGISRKLCIVALGKLSFIQCALHTIY